MNQYADAKKKLIELNKKIKLLGPEFSDVLDTSRVSISEVKEGILDGESIERVIVILRNSGCAWATKDEGGCLMCGHYCGTTRGKKLTPENYIKQIDYEMGLYDFNKYPMLCIYNSGSFLNEEEIPIEARQYIFKKIASIKGIHRLIIESRPEYITDAILDEIDTFLPNKTVEIGVGLETSSEEIRDLCLNKGIETKEYVSVAKRMKNYHSKLLGYVLLKPPFLTEAESIEDSISTIKYAFNIGFDVISLEPVSVQNFTLIDYLFESGYYRSPWIWSVIEVIKQTYKLGLVRIGGFEFFPVPSIFAHNCEKCNLKFIKAIKEFNRSYEPKVFEGINCECKKEWEFDLQEKIDEYPLRILKILDSINENYILGKMKSKFETRGDTENKIVKLLYKSCSTPNL